MHARTNLKWLAPFIALLSALALAQTPAPPKRPEDELFAKIRAARNDPAQTIELTVKLVQEFPDTNLAESAGFTFATTLRRQARTANDAAQLRLLTSRFIEGTATAPTPLRVRINSAALRAMLELNLDNQAAQLARQTIPLLNEQEYLTSQRKGYDRDIERAVKANPKYQPRPFLEADFRERFRQESATYHSLLGRALLKLNDLSQAQAAFKQAYDLGRDAPAAAGLATVLEKQGKDAEALEYMTEAVLTGKLDKPGLEQFRGLYRRTHKDKLDGVEDYLDARYRRAYRNPVKSTKPTPPRTRAGRAVLAEFFTGAGCIPCIPFDYSFEAALADYPRKDLVLLVYHWHAPSLDPLGNRASDARVTFYGVQGAPTTFINGQRFKIEGGADDTRIKSAAEKVTATVYAAVTETIKRELASPASAQLKLKATRAGHIVNATVTIEGLKDAAPNATLQLALVEEEVRYSGENGLRFHPMVVRNLAKPADYGFKAAPGKVAYAFDLESISAANLRYYDEWPAERNKEVNARIGGEADFDVGKFKEQRHVINPDHLSVVAFLQDNQTKAILQAVYVKLTPVGESRKPLK